MLFFLSLCSLRVENQRVCNPSNHGLFLLCLLLHTYILKYRNTTCSICIMLLVCVWFLVLAFRRLFILLLVLLSWQFLSIVEVLWNFMDVASDIHKRYNLAAIFIFLWLLKTFCSLFHNDSWVLGVGHILYPLGLDSTTLSFNWL